MSTPKLPDLLGHPDDSAEEWLSEEYENSDDSNVGYDREAMIDAFRAGAYWARRQIARFGKDESGRWVALAPSERANSDGESGMV